MKTTRALAALICLVLALALLPAPALAADSTVRVFVAGWMEFPSGDAYGTELGDGWYVNGTGGALGTVETTEPTSWNAHFDKTTGTLYLKSFVLTGCDKSYGLFLKHGGGGSTESVILDLTGESTSSVVGVWNSAGLATDSILALNVQSSSGGSLTATCGGGVGAMGISLSGTALTVNSGTLRCIASGSGEGYTGIISNADPITVNGGTLIAEGPANGRGMYCGGDLSVTDGTLSVSGGEGAYLLDDLTIEDGTATFDGQNIGANVVGALTISGGTALFKGSTIGAAAPSAIDLSGYIPAPDITASDNIAGTPPTTYSPTNPPRYKYLKLQPGVAQYAIALESPVGTELKAYTFPTQMVDYAANDIPALNVTVKNTGSNNLPTGPLSVSITGSGAAAFDIPQTPLASVASGGTGSFTVGVKAGNTADTYDATVSVGPAPGNTNPFRTKSFSVRFVASVTPVSTVAQPTFIPAGGTYDTAPTVTISCATTGAEIRYTLNGDEPDEHSPLYSAPVRIDASATLRAKAFKDRMLPSPTASATYTITSPQVEAPTFDPLPGIYPSVQNVELRCATPGAQIRYTLDSTEPNDQSPLYSAPIPVTSTTVATTIKTKAFKPGWDPSAMVTGVYNITPPGTVPAPTFDPPEGAYTGAQNIALACELTDAAIHYTTNGDEPDETSPLYSAPITISADATIKAKAYKSGMTPSAIASAAYTISTPPRPIPGGSGSGFPMARGGGYMGNTYQGSITLNAKGALVCTVQADYNKVSSILLDGIPLVIGKDCSLVEGSTIVTVFSSCLAALKDGAHTLRVQYTDGRYESTFTTPLSASLTAAAVPNVPATGAPVGGAPLWAAFALLSLLGAAYRKKRA